MTQEEKQLLLKDLCARLMYGVKCACSNNFNGEFDIISPLSTSHIDMIIGGIHPVKPYLRPMSSMTEEEREEYQAFFNYDGVEYPEEYIDWLNAHHFDYRGLIEKGLALEATEEVYELKH